MNKTRSRPKLNLQRLDSPTADLRRILSTNQSCIHSSSKRSPVNKPTLLNLSTFSTTILPTPKAILLSFENTPIANEDSHIAPSKSPFSIPTQGLPRGSIVNPNKSPTPMAKSHLININPRSRASPGLPQHFLITEKRHDSSLSLRSIQSHSQSKKELAFPPKATLRLNNSPSKLALSETLSIMNSPSHISLASSSRNNNVSTDRLKRIDDHVNRQQKMKLKKDILKKVFAEATSPVNSPKYTKFLSFLTDDPKTPVAHTPIHTGSPTGFLRIKKRQQVNIQQQPQMEQVSLTEKSEILEKKRSEGKERKPRDESKENKPEEETPKAIKDINYFITSSADLHKSVRAQYLFEPDSENLVRNSLGIKIKPFVLEGFDPSTVKYNNVFVSKVYKKPRPVLVKKGSAQSQGSSGSNPESKTTLDEKSKRETSLEASVRRCVEKEQSCKSLLQEMKSSNVTMGRDLAYHSTLPKPGTHAMMKKDGFSDRFLLFNSPKNAEKVVGEEKVL